MPCNCTKKKKDLVWVYTPTTGPSQTFASEVQAKAAQVRAGGGSVKSQPK